MTKTLIEEKMVINNLVNQLEQRIGEEHLPEPEVAEESQPVQLPHLPAEKELKFATEYDSKLKDVSVADRANVAEALKANVDAALNNVGAFVNPADTGKVIVVQNIEITRKKDPVSEKDPSDLLGQQENVRP